MMHPLYSYIKDILSEKTGYISELFSISGRTTAVVHALPNCYAPTFFLLYMNKSFFGISAMNCLRSFSKNATVSLLKP